MVITAGNVIAAQDSVADPVENSPGQGNDGTDCAPELDGKGDPALNPKATATLLQSVLEKDGEGGCRKLMSPFLINFSQLHVRPDFQDGHTSEEALALVKPTLCSGVADFEESGAPVRGKWWLLQCPFPEIEIIQWRCKIRESDGSLKLNEDGVELYAKREWYSLDNRRLLVMQKMAVKLWPMEVRCSVMPIRQEDGSCREFRKFSTLDCGRTVRIGRENDGPLVLWSWRAEIGLPAEPTPTGTTIARAPKRRHSTGRLGSQRSGRKQPCEGENESEGHMEFTRSLLLFLMVYLILRLILSAGRHLTGRTS